MEVAAHLAGEELIDSSPTMSRAIGEFLIPVADAMPNVERQKLLRIVPLLVRSADRREVEEARGDFLAKCALEVFFPMALEAGGGTMMAGWLRRDASLGFLKESLVLARYCSRDIPLVNECANAACVLFEALDRPERVSLAAGLTGAVMAINDELGRRLCLHEGRKGPLLAWERKAPRVRRVPEIYDAIVKTIEAAIKLGKYTPLDDPWEVLAKAADFEEALLRRREGIPIRTHATFVN